MKIIKFEAENIKKLRAVEIVPDGSVVQITGPNGSGKSSVLDAIYMALAGTRGIDSQPVRKGTQSASIRLDLGDVKVTRKFTEGGGTSLVVEAESGARFPSPQKMLDELMGALTFDPLAFSRMEPKKQLDTLRGLVKIEIDIDELDGLIARDYAERTEFNRKAKDLAAQKDAIKVAEDLPDEPIDVDGLLDKMAGAANLNAAIDDEIRKRENGQARARALGGDALAKREQAARLMQEADELENEENVLRNALAALPPVPEKHDVAELRFSVDRAREVNALIGQRTKRESLKRDHALVAERVAELTRRIEATTQEKQDAIAAADMPIEGLSFGDGEVIYNALPFGQASSAEQLRVSVAIAMAGNPKLRVLRIKDGSLLDERSLAMIADMAEEQDYQIWLEQVDTSGKVGVVMEEGEVISTHPKKGHHQPQGAK